MNDRQSGVFQGTTKLGEALASLIVAWVTVLTGTTPLTAKATDNLSAGNYFNSYCDYREYTIFLLA